ncbi:MAG: hypothetical protein AAFX99_08765 [Myxococcota bacterium]
MSWLRYTGVLGGLVLLGWVWGGCSPVAPSPPATPGAANEEPLELRSYTFPEQRHEHAYGALHSVLTQQGQPWRVTRGLGDQVLVLAPARVQRDIQAFVEQVGSPEYVVAPRKTVQLTYWLVVGRRGDDTRSVPEVEKALSAIESDQGPMEFVLLEKLSMQSLEGKHAQSQGMWLEAGQHIWVEENIQAEVSLEVKGGSRLQTQLNMTPEQYVVLGQAGYPSGHAAELFGLPIEEVKGDAFELFYIVQATRK